MSFDVHIEIKRSTKKWMIGLIFAFCGGAMAMGQAMLPTFYSGPWKAGPLPTGWTANGLRISDYSENYDGIDGNAAGLDTAGDWIKINVGSAPSTVSYWLKGASLSGEYTFKTQESEDGSIWTDIAIFNSGNPIPNSPATAYTNNLSSASRYIQFIYVTKAAGNVGIDGVRVAGPAVPSVSFNPNGTTNAPVSNLFTMAVTISPSGAGMQSWNMEPAYSGPASLSGGTFSFTPAAADYDKAFTVSVVATNSIGTTTGMVTAVVTPYVPPSPIISFFPDTPYNIMATYTQRLGIGVIPEGSGIQGWTLLPSNYAGSATLVGTNFTFTTAEADGGEIYTLTIVATNEFPPTTGMASIAVSEYVPPPPPNAYICTFEDGTKTGYASGDVMLSNKVWNLTGILIGTTANDLKIGAKAAHLKYNASDGEETMTIQSAVMSNGISTISLWYGPYGSHGSTAPTLAIEISESLSSGWMQVGEVACGAVTALTYYSCDVYVSTPLYVRIRATSGITDKIANFDNITITPYPEDRPPVITFTPPVPYRVMATATQWVGVKATPIGSGISSWALLPSNYSGSATLADTNFFFTPALTDGPGDYSLAIVATNENGSSTGTVGIAVLPRYDIAIAPATNGTIATIPADGTSAGTTVVISTIPDDGFAQGDIVVLDSDLNPVEVTNNVFTMPASAVTVSVSFVPSHSITVSPPVHGTLTTTPALAAGEGATVVVTATPDIGYIVESISVVDAASNFVAVADSRFIMPSSVVYVAATFSLLPAPVVTNGVRYQNFNDWSDPAFAESGLHSLHSWTLQNGQIAPTAGVLNTRAAWLAPQNSAIVSPAFADGVGQVTFWARPNHPGESAYMLLQSSGDGGSNWVGGSVFAITGAVTCTEWLCISNSAAMVRLIFDPDKISGAALIDNIEIRVPTLYRAQNFDGWPTHATYTNKSYQGWSIVTGIVDSTYAFLGKVARLHPTPGSYIQSPELLGGIGAISFRTRKFAASDVAFTIQIQRSPDGTNWNTITNVSATSTNYDRIAYYMRDKANRFVRLFHSAGVARVLIDDILITEPQPRPEVAITPGLDPPIPLADEPMSLLAVVEPRFGASVVSVTGTYRIEYGSPVDLPMAFIGGETYAALEPIPALPVGTMVRVYAQVQYAGIGAAPDSVKWTTNVVVSAVVTNIVSTQTFDRITVQGSFIATNNPPPNMMRIAGTPVWESDHHITNSGFVSLRFAADMDGVLWGVTNETAGYELPASDTLIMGETNYANVAVNSPGRYRITFNYLTRRFTLSQVYSDDSQGTFPNLLKNPGFEITTDPEGGDANGWLGWQAWPKSVAEDVAPHSGNWSGALYGQCSNGWSDFASFSQEVAVGEGRTYLVSAWLKATPDWTADAMQIKVDWRSADDESAGSDMVFPVPSLSTNWTKYSVESVAPVDARIARVSISCIGAGAAGSMHMDDAEMRLIGPTNYYATAFGRSGMDLRRTLQEIISVARINDYDSLHAYYLDSDARSDGTVWDMYSDNPNGQPPYVYRFETCEQAGTYRIEGDVYNREHSWPKSWFNSLSPMYTDIFHIYPTDGEVNGNRGNYPFGEITWPAIVSLNGSKTGPCSAPGYTGTVFEPIDAYKGDFARTYFYMSTRYYGLDSGWQTNAAVKGAELNPWALEMLLRWHEDDPVSRKELVRNEAAYLAQGNRNPFVDYPEWAHDIWGYATNRELPGITIEAPITLLSSVSPDPGVMSIQGQVSGQVAGRLVWSNSITRGAGSLLLTGTNFLLSDIPLAYGQNQVHLIVSNGLGQTAGRSMVVFRQSGARETFDDEAAWKGAVCDKYWDREFASLRYVSTNRLCDSDAYAGTEVAIKKSITMDAHGCSWGLSPFADNAMVRFQTPGIVTNFSVYLANFTSNAATEFQVLVSTNSGWSYEVMLETNSSWFGAAQQFKKYESPPLYAKPQPGMLTYVEIVKTSGEMLFVDDFDCATMVDPDDTDMDGLPDAWELAHFGALELSDGSGDYDRDGLTDAGELYLGTSPLLKDTDGDGQSDWEESVAGTGGTDEEDYFSIEEISPATESLDPLVLYWNSAIGRTYRLWYGLSMTGDWSSATQVLQTEGDGQRKSYTNENSDRTGFYRLTVEKP